MKIFVLVLALAMYALVIAFTHKKAWIALGAAAIVLVAGAVGVGQAITELVSWNILMIYIGSLVIADLFIYSRVPAYIADKIVDKSPTLGIAIVAILVMTGLISAFVENVATVLVMAPIALEICRRLKLNPTAFMIGLAVMANLQGTATLVGDPPSMIFASYAGYGFNDFFFYAGKLSIFFAVQVGAFRDDAKLAQARGKLTAAKVPHYTERLDAAAGDLTRLRAGPFPTREAAEKAAAQLKRAGLDGRVVTLP